MLNNKLLEGRIKEMTFSQLNLLNASL